jgi:hypothetical protein
MSGNLTNENAGYSQEAHGHWTGALVKKKKTELDKYILT